MNVGSTDVIPPPALQAGHLRQMLLGAGRVGKLSNNEILWYGVVPETPYGLNSTEVHSGAGS
jgi:hypothetical protein